MVFLSAPVWTELSNTDEITAVQVFYLADTCHVYKSDGIDKMMITDFLGSISLFPILSKGMLQALLGDILLVVMK